MVFKSKEIKSLYKKSEYTLYFLYMFLTDRVLIQSCMTISIIMDQIVELYYDSESKCDALV